MPAMMILPALPLLLLLADPTEGKGWVEAAKEDGITVYSRVREDSSIGEMKAIGLMDAAPHEVWKAVRDYPNYPKTMPYTEESKVLATEGGAGPGGGGAKITWFYSVVNAPLVDRRDYVIKLIDESDWKDGKGYLLVRWSASDEKAPPLKEDVVRVKVNEGMWKLEPRDGGKKTFATYWVYTDPGGSLPKWIANKANNTAVPNVFAAIKKVVADDRAAAAARREGK
jgi:hypothetical protein